MKNTQITTMSVSLPKELKEHVKRRVRQEHFGTPSDYIRNLIRGDIKRQEQDRLETMLVEGLASGTPSLMSGSDWKKLRAEAASGLA